MKHIAVFCMALALAGQWCVAEEYDAAKLMELAPQLGIGSPLVSSFHVYGDGVAVHSSFDVAYERPGRVALRFVDTSDGTPFLWATGRDVLIYDAQHARVITGQSKSISFYFRGDDATQSLVCAVFIDEDSVDTLRLDFRSLLGLVSGPKAASADGRVYDLEGATPSGNRLQAYFDPKDVMPLKRLLVLAPDHAVQFKIEPIEINQPIAHATWEFASKEQLVGLPMAPLAPWLKDSKAKRTLLASMPTLQFRAALGDPKLRDSWESEFGKVDWQVAQRKDAEISAQLRKIFKPHQQSK